MTDYVEVTTKSYRTRHYARPEAMHTSPHAPGRHGESVCQTNNLSGVVDQDRADFWTRGFRTQPVIADLPLCKRCAKTTGGAR